MARPSPMSQLRSEPACTASLSIQGFGASVFCSDLSFQERTQNTIKVHVILSRICFPRLTIIHTFQQSTTAFSKTQLAALNSLTMFSSIFKLVNLAVVAIALAQTARCSPLTSSYSTASPVTTGVHVLPERLHNSTVQNHAAVLAGPTKGGQSSIDKRQTTGDIEAHWQFVQEEQVCGDYGEVCFNPWAYLWVDWYANGATSPSMSPFHN